MLDRPGSLEVVETDRFDVEGEVDCPVRRPKWCPAVTESRRGIHDCGIAFEVNEGAIVLFAPKLTSAEALDRVGLSEDDLMLQLQDRPT